MGKFMKSITCLVVLMIGASAFAASGEIELEKSGNDPGNTSSLQRGARNFMSYCAGCHSAKYVRYNSIARDLELNEEQLIDNLMFNAQRPFETIQA